MNNIFNQLKKVSRLLVIILFFVAAFFTFLAGIGNFDDEFMPVMGNLFLIIFVVGLLVAVPILLLFKKDAVAKTVFMIYGSYWLINYIINELSHASMANSFFNGLTITIGVFDFLIGCALLTAVVFYVLGKIKKDGKLFVIATYIIFGIFGFSFVTYILNVVSDYDIWFAYFYHLSTYLVLPAAMFFGMLLFDLLEVTFPEKPKAAVKELESPEEVPKKADQEEYVVTDEVPFDETSISDTDGEPDTADTSDTDDTIPETEE